MCERTHTLQRGPSGGIRRKQRRIDNGRNEGHTELREGRARLFTFPVQSGRLCAAMGENNKASKPQARRTLFLVPHQLPLQACLGLGSRVQRLISVPVALVRLNARESLFPVKKKKEKDGRMSKT